MNDEEFLLAFTAGVLPPAHFHHRDHLRLAWLLNRRLGHEAAGIAVAAGIRRFAANHGHAAKYHETLSQFWVRLVGHMVRVQPAIADFDAFIAAFPILLDKGLPYRHWHEATMASTAARTTWVEPDLLALPR
jgi:hypothetical protein